MLKRTVLQILALVAAACVAGYGSNAVRAKLEWTGNDPVLLKHDTDGVTADEAAQVQNDAATLFLDVRSPAAFAAGRIHGAVSFPADSLDVAYEELRDYLGPEVKVIVYGDETLPAVRAAEFLKARGQTVRVLEGGWQAWQQHQLPVEREPTP